MSAIYRDIEEKKTWTFCHKSLSISIAIEKCMALMAHMFDYGHAAISPTAFINSINLALKIYLNSNYSRKSIFVFC